MIRIISGAYGGKNGLIRPNDPPFSLSPEKEKRLVDRGVAEYVIENGIQLHDDSSIPVYDISMTEKQLRGLADVYKIDHKKVKGKQNLIDLLDSHFASLDDQEDFDAEELEEDNNEPETVDDDAPILNADLPTV